MENGTSQGFRLSPQQQRLWQIQSRDPQRPFRADAAILITGQLDVELLNTAIANVIAHHEILRTHYQSLPDHSSAAQVITDAGAPVLARFDLTDLDNIDQLARADLLFEEIRHRQIDLANGPILHTALLKLANDTFMLFISLPALSADNVSLAIFVRELAHSYQAAQQYEAPYQAATDEVVQYADLAEWMNQLLEDEDAATGQQYWRKQQYHALATMKLGHQQRPLPQARFKPTIVNLNIDLDLREQIISHIAERNISLPDFLQSCWQILLARLIKQPEIIIGRSYDGRRAQELSQAIGLFARYLPIHCRISPTAKFIDIYHQIEENSRAAEKWQDYFSWPQLPELSAQTEYLPFCFDFIDESTSCDLDQLNFTLLNRRVYFDQFKIKLVCTYKSDLMAFEFHYDRNYFSQDDIIKLSDEFQRLKQSIINDPECLVGDLEILGSYERRQIIHEFNQTQIDYPLDHLVHQLIAQQLTDQQIAVLLAVENGPSLSYSALNNRANQLANFLIDAGVKPDVIVAVCMERSLEMVITLLGIMKAGGAYLPIDPAYPKERVDFMLDDAQPKLLLTQTHLIDRFSDQPLSLLALDRDWQQFSAQSERDPAVALTLDHLAYVIYTSGSTGRPKGVMNTHRGLLNRLQWMQQIYQLNSDDAVLQKTPFSFDVSVWEFFWPLMYGAKLVVAKPGGHQDPAYLIEAINQNQITTIHFVPSMLQIFLQHADVKSCTSLKRVICSGEALSVELQARFFQVFANVELYNLYGPTEASIDVTCWQCQRDDQRGSVPIGRPIANTQIYILGENGEPLPIGVAGELHIGGVGVARGYLNREDLTLAKFIPDPFNPEMNGRLYRTGDLARFLPDGTIEYLGRLDHQIKLRGFRIELGEIEATLLQHEEINEAVVIARDNWSDEKCLIAYLVAKKSGTTDRYFETQLVGKLREFLKTRLPEYMLPWAFVPLDRLPLSPNGKVDRNALAALPLPEYTHQFFSENEIVARNAFELSITYIWQQLLKLDHIGIHANFFELGGHSLLAIQVITRIRSAWDIEFPLQTFFDNPTIAALAAVTRSAHHSRVRRLLPELMPTNFDSDLPLSFAQQRLWFLHQWQPQSPFYNLPAAIRLRGNLDIAALTESFNRLIARQKSLRTSFITVAGSPMQHIAPSLTITLEITDLSALDKAAREPEALRLAEIVAGQPFDLTRAPLWRASLLRLADDEHILLITMHHIISDFWSMKIFIQEMTEFYQAIVNNQTASLNQLFLQYADYVIWQRELLQGDYLQAQLTYWRAQLAGAPPLLQLPLDHARPAVQTFSGARKTFQLSTTTTEALRALGQREATTLFITLLATFQLLLSRYSNQEDIVIGVPIAGRTHQELESLIGFFVNTLVLRVDLTGKITFRELLARARSVTLAAYDHQDLPFEKLVDELQPERNTSHTPLFQVIFQSLNVELKMPEVAGLQISFLELPSSTVKFDLNLTIFDAAENVSGALAYNTALFDGDTIDRMLKHYLNLIDAIVADPDRTIKSYPLLSVAEEEQILNLSSLERREFRRDLCAHQLFEQQVERTPDAIALAFNGHYLTYRSLNERANQLAYFLQRNGVRPDTIVGIFTERSFEMVIAVFAVLKAGGAYLPLSTAYPKERLAQVLADTALPILITQSSLIKLLPPIETQLIPLDEISAQLSSEPRENPRSEVKPEHLVYIIYTSGSTGRPKGVMITHAGLVNGYQAWEERYQLRSLRALLQMANFSFDVCTQDIFRALCAGLKLVLCPTETLLAPQQLYQLMIDEHVDAAEFVPAVLRHFIDYLSEANLTLDFMRLIISGADIWYLKDFQKIHARCGDNTRLINSFGVTEATIDNCCYEASADAVDKLIENSAGGIVPIGKPFANTEIYLLDDEMQPVPIGVAGELYIGGIGVARGYLNRPELTAERFLPDPFSNKADARTSNGIDTRIYRTGDRARYLKDGNIEFLGRADLQIKLRGFRIEPGEIEAVLKAYPAVRESVVIAREDQRGDRHLVAYLTLSGDNAPSTSELRAYAQQQLPDYMVPAVFIILPSLPLTPNGKLDRAALPKPERDRPELSHAFSAPRNQLETMLAEMWQAVLSIDQIGIFDNFFELGGDSIKGAIFINRLQERLQEFIYIVAIFDAPNIAALAEYLTSQYPTAISRLLGSEIKVDTANDSIVTDAARVDARMITECRALIPPLPSRGENYRADKNPRAIFILSPPRSGTTLFRIMLAGNPRLFVPQELELLSFNTLAERKAAFPARDSFWLEGALRAIIEVKGCSAEEAKEMMQQYETEGMTTQQFYSLLQQWIGERVLVDKTVSYALDLEILRRAEEDFRDPIYLHLIRHPMAMIHSFEEAKLSQVLFRHQHNYSVRQLADLIWNISHENIEQFLQDIPNWRKYRVRFEDLIKAPQAMLENLCESTGLEYHADMAEPYKEKEKRMTDGIHSVSKMLGDYKYHEHKAINPAVADKWREDYQEDFLGEVTWQQASRYGYYRDEYFPKAISKSTSSQFESIKPAKESEPEINIDEMSDADVAAMLKELLAQGGEEE